MRSQQGKTSNDQLPKLLQHAWRGLVILPSCTLFRVGVFCFRAVPLADISLTTNASVVDTVWMCWNDVRMTTSWFDLWLRKAFSGRTNFKVNRQMAIGRNCVQLLLTSQQMPRTISLQDVERPNLSNIWNPFVVARESLRYAVITSSSHDFGRQIIWASSWVMGEIQRWSRDHPSAANHSCAFGETRGAL